MWSCRSMAQCCTKMCAIMEPVWGHCWFCFFVSFFIPLALSLFLRASVFLLLDVFFLSFSCLLRLRFVACFVLFRLLLLRCRWGFGVFRVFRLKEGKVGFEGHVDFPNVPYVVICYCLHFVFPSTHPCFGVELPVLLRLAHIAYSLRVGGLLLCARSQTAFLSMVAFLG